MECELWSLHVDDAGDGGGGMSGLLVVDSGGFTSFSFTSGVFSSLERRKITCVKVGSINAVERFRNHRKRIQYKKSKKFKMFIFQYKGLTC